MSVLSTEDLFTEEKQIYRKEAIEILSDTDHLQNVPDGYYEALDLAIEALEALVQGNAICKSCDPGWIPCTKELPRRDSKAQKRGVYMTTNGYGDVGITTYEFESGSFGFVGWRSDIRIDAWMPLPKGYVKE